MKIWKSNNIFSMGEISPNLYHRYDLPQYRAGLSTLNNCIPNVEGGVVSVPELEYKSVLLEGQAGYSRIFKYTMEEKFGSDTVLMVITTGGVYLKVININNNITATKVIASAYTENQIKNLSIIQLENNVLICTKGQKPQMIKFVDDDINKAVLVNFWEAITDPPIKPTE
ncbi:MAG: hypothetical protein ACRC6E_02305, partial [Fusobacteriaceae bacterium]